MSAASDSPPPLLDVAQIAAAGRALAAPFRCRLRLRDAAGERAVEVCCREILRLLPGRRLVAQVDLGGDRRLLKLFLGAGARRYCRREARGCAHLAHAGVPTPARLATVSAAEAGVAVCGLLFEYIPAAARASADAATLRTVAAWLARLHARGCRHADLHLDNVLAAADGRRLLIDGDGVRRARPWGALGRRASLANLGVLCAQGTLLEDEDFPGVYAAYAEARGWPADAVALAAGAEALRRAAVRQRRRRMRRYGRKCLRDCSEFRVELGWRRRVTALRAAWNDDLAAFVAHPEAAFAGAEVLKAGNSATVVRTRIGGRARVVKRYNVKGPWHAVRRSLQRLPRYRLAWQNGQLLTLLGVPTARPLLLLERRRGLLRGVAYLVMEDLGDRDLAAVAATGFLEDHDVRAVAALFRALAAAGLVHGDTKATNFLMGPRGIHLVDLDAMTPSRSGAARDLRRFLTNFDAQPALRARFEAAFREAGLL